MICVGGNANGVLGMCFFVGGIFHPQQTFHEAISEVGSNLMLVAAGK